MTMRTLSRAGHLSQHQRSRLRRAVSVPLLLPALVLAGCVTGGSLPREADFTPRSGCRADAVLNELLGRHPGVQVSREGSGLRVRVRGAPQEPLYVLDGQPLEISPWGARPVVNPCDIQEIRVLTNPADLTFYGLRGANGVILITTRRR